MLYFHPHACLSTCSLSLRGSRATLMLLNYIPFYDNPVFSFCSEHQRFLGISLHQRGIGLKREDHIFSSSQSHTGWAHLMKLRITLGTVFKRKALVLKADNREHLFVLSRRAVRWRRGEEHVQQSAQAHSISRRVPGLPGVSWSERQTARPHRWCSAPGGSGGERVWRSVHYQFQQL